MRLKIMIIYMYIAPRPSQTTHDSNFFLQKCNSSDNLVICCKFSALNYFVTVFPIQTHRQPNLTFTCQPRVTILFYINFAELESQMLHVYAKFQDRPVLEKIFKALYHIWAWQPSWSCDLDHL